MNREEVIIIFEKETTCFDKPMEACSMRNCDECDCFISEATVRDAMKAAIDILKNEEKE